MKKFRWQNKGSRITKTKGVQKKIEVRQKENRGDKRTK